MTTRPTFNWIAALVTAGWLLAAPSFAQDNKPEIAPKKPSDKTPGEKQPEKPTKPEKSTKAEKPEPEKKPAHKPNKEGKPNKDNKPTKDTEAAREKRAQAVLLFVAEQHPELGGLLTSLRETQPEKYRQAINDLARISEKLQALHLRDPQAYDVELQLWRVDSRLQLLAARMGMSDDPALEGEARQLLKERLDLRRAKLQLDRARLEKQLAGLNQQAAKLNAEPDQEVERQLERLKKGVVNPSPRKEKPSANQAAPR